MLELCARLWIPASMRREFSKAIKRAAYDRSDGFCEGLLPNRLRCNTPNSPVEYDHDKPDYMGGEPVLSNCLALCKICHRMKTGRERPMLDKTRRIVDRNKYGIKKRSRFAGSRTVRGRKKSMAAWCRDERSAALARCCDTRAESMHLRQDFRCMG